MNIYVLTTLEVGAHSINILRKHLDIRGVIGLTKREAGHKISGYQYLKPFCKECNLNFIEVESYSLSANADRNKLLGLDIDVLIVAGWQRLIPPWLISHCKICAIGSHGSVHGITGGRGRSPQNWALLLGKREFHISIFKIDEGIDSGAVIDTQKYVLTELDDIKTSYYKVCWLTSHMIISAITSGRIEANDVVEQAAEARYMPQRLPQDGEIDWSRTSKEIYDFVRALTKPYPGAFSCLDSEKVIIWRCRPFDIPNEPGEIGPGEVVAVYTNHDFLVKTGDALMLVEEYSFPQTSQRPFIREGNKFASASYTRQINTVIDRHYRKHPELVITQDILDIVGR